MPNLTVNGRRVTVAEDATLLDAARAAGVEVPTLCQFDGLEPCASSTSGGRVGTRTGSSW